MKNFIQSRAESRGSKARGFRPPGLCLRPSTFDPRPASAFTLVEIAICLAIIGIALVAIIGVLPRGLDVQRENRERTVINQDATIFMEAIRNGAQGADDLTNYVYQVEVSADNNLTNTGPFRSGKDIIGLLSWPNSTNHANVRSISGPAVEKPPQDNTLLTGDSFSYRMLCEIRPVQTADAKSAYGNALAANLHEVRLTFYWPILPNGNLPSRPWHQTFRTLIAGEKIGAFPGTDPTLKLYFFQNQSFTTNAP
ncbi:MAG TPA: type II secretion system protein [Verrucomicrobiae bacterium]|jgi:type II secretory pathway pseudopilin PulG|nr:type II secretion system protein [Verrucomicrobiae bacterium]